MFAVSSVVAEDEPSAVAEVAAVASPLSHDIEDLKKTALELNRDLLILEEELLFPANTQIMVFLSLDTGAFFQLDAVKLHIDDKLVASHLYTPRQNDALSRGGIQRLFVGNLKTGEHELTAYFTGIGPDKREYKRGATLLIDKDDDPKMLELRIKDASANMQPEFDFKEWQL
ncbi:AraC family transcriptional regulator [Teredinibacter purpureus]|uniref:AraC family transcriptional regulator n=1 Tax=Teredinibacter purpureus TaxID=2731756 RepID=UPI0038B4803E